MGLAARMEGRLRLAEPMAKHCSFKLGGPAEAWAQPHDQLELAECLKAAKALGAPLTILAGGTNVLVLDGGIPGLVLSLDGGFNRFSLDDDGVVSAGAGFSLALLARKTALSGLAGLEWAVGIPGSVGGGLVMNAGAHGGEMKDVVSRVRVLVDGQPEDWSAEQCGFAYRHSAFKGVEPGRLIALGAQFRLTPAEPEALKARMDEALAKRKASQPLEWPNAGSVFKNPPGQAAGALIEQCGLKGLSRGGAQISEKHANFVVNKGGATAADVQWLMQAARDAVRQKFDVELVDEVLTLGVQA
jgi:UDP-N-acetylmuramate dehydrogenase